MGNTLYVGKAYRPRTLGSFMLEHPSFSFIRLIQSQHMTGIYIYAALIHYTKGKRGFDILSIDKFIWKMNEKQEV